MQAGGVTTIDAYNISGRVLIDGNDIGAEVQTVSLGRDIPSGLPGDSGFTSATGTVTATWGDDVSERVDHPWSGDPVWPPRPQARVEVLLSDGSDHEWTQFKGVVVDPSGSTSTRVISFGVRDTYRALDTLATLPALSDQMPSLVDTNDYRHIGLQTPFITDWVLRQAGRYATPPQSGGCVVSATLMGSAWPERGEVTASIKNTPDEFSNNSPNWRNTDYGLCAHNLNAEYEPYLWSGLPGRLTTTPVELTQEVVQPSDGATYLRARFGGGGRVALVFSNTTIQARYYRPDGGNDIMLTVPKTGRTRATARFSLSGQWLEVELRTRRTNGTVRSEGNASLNVGHDALAGVINHVWANGGGAQGAFQVAFPSTPWRPLNHDPTAVIHAALAGRNFLRGLPTQVNANALDLLNDQADAEFAQWWIDEHDVLQWWDRGLLAQQPTVGTLTSADHVKELSWSHDHDSARHHVHVNYKHPEITQRWRTTLILWQGGTTTLDQGDEDEQFINVPDDEVWLGVDWEDPIWYSRTTSWWGAVNRGIKSVIGGIAVDDDDGERLTNSILPTMRRITDAAYVITTNIASLSGDEQAALQFPDDGFTDPELWARWLGEKLPIVRGKKKVTLVEETYTSEIVGDDQAPDYTHDVGWWIQDVAVAGRTADYAAASLTQPRPRVTGLDILPVLALQAGDHIRVSLPDVAELELTGVVTSNNLDADLAAGVITQSISLMPTNIASLSRQWADFGVTQNGAPWQAWATTTVNDTWSDFGTAPLT